MPSSCRLPLILATAVVLLTGAACAGGADAGDSGSVAAGAPLAEVATDNLFAPDTVAISAGEAYTLTMTNQGEAIHNWHVLDAMREGNKSIETPLTAPRKSSRTTFAIPRAGTYHFQCDVHPDTMRGTLTVR